jgi:hypothetical protein
MSGKEPEKVSGGWNVQADDSGEVEEIASYGCIA